MPPTPKTVLMLQLDEQQGRIWDAALQSQGIQVDWRPANVDVVEMLKTIDAKALPDLLIMDIGVKSPTSNSLQVVPVCQWCRSLSTPLKVLLLNSNSNQIKAYEEKWATGKCGAIGIVPKLTQATLGSTIGLVSSILSRTLKQESLDEVALLIADIYTENLEFEITKIKNEIAASAPPEITPKATPVVTYRGAAIDTPKPEESLSDTRIQPPSETTPVPEAPKPKVTTYRGVKVKKIQW
ncbi:hypothetical protein Syn7502_02761 [Synechococcus sp. PCC 7502]|uniref:hypothetical protein n=1 Tax=Synechococcus sp. PCC 7502 TaxID=1173263 RepID=UPI00029F891F|nr:hypothetical protein [Synechococcus sp. PCC 7502]AFY74699.1 hypothetical protein Syn7502_02761 [Synechococcus sp. PCC 7502]